MSDNEDYWGTSDVKVKALKFDDDELSSQQFSKLGAEVRAGLNTTSSIERDDSFDQPRHILLPLYDVIPKAAMENVLLAQSGMDPSSSIQNLYISQPSVAICLKKLVVGRSCSLYHHKSLESKTLLLDGAIALGDGNAILAVILFLVQTLKKKIFYQLVSSRPIAVNHYINYLIIRLRTHDLVDLLTMLGRSGDAAMKQYQMIMQASSPSLDVLISKLKNLLSNHFTPPNVDPLYINLVTNYVKLLEWQKGLGIVELHHKSVIESLAHCCAYHWSDGVGKVTSPQTFCQQHQINSQQFDWTALSTHAALKKWEIIETMFLKKSFLGRTTLSCSVSLPKIIGRLHELGSNSILLGIYLNHITSIDQRLELSKKHKAHRTVLDCYMIQKDRQALTQYKMTLHPQSEEYFHAENALRIPTIQWKN